MANDTRKLRDKLRIRRKKQGLTQQEIADYLGISRSFYGLIEAGSREPSLMLAFKIAHFFNTTIEELFYHSYWTDFLASRALREKDVYNPRRL